MLGISRNLFDDLFSLHREMDRVFERNWGALPRWLPSQTTFIPEVESYTKDGNLCYRIAIPGVDPQKVDLSIVGNEVTVKGERTAPMEVDDENWHFRELRYGQFERTFTLPEAVEIEKVNATFNNGILEISAPISKAHLPRKVEIKQIGSSESKQQLKASA
jgi:HSP20 family protein